jgi:nicotinate-nucleotide pyrophosphorylase (carboxylating)
VATPGPGDLIAQLRAFLAEDVGEGDVTTDALLGRPAATRPSSRRASRPEAALPATEGRVVAREPLVVAGLAEASLLFADSGIKVEHRAQDADRVAGGTVLLSLKGPAATMLKVERVALNILMHMSGIATFTRELQSRIDRVNPSCRIAATRKTTPGFREFEKRAVVLGGGDPHRTRLDSGFLVKDNHLALGVPIGEAVRRCREANPFLPLEVEVETVQQAEEAAKAGADWVLLDNLAAPEAQEIALRLRRIDPGIKIECSGGIKPETIEAYAAFSDRISLGRLTLGAPPRDIALDIDPSKPAKR